MKKRRKKLLPTSPQEWLNHAMSDLALARLGMNSNDVLPEQVCFHAQQAVEKAIKSVLLHNKIPFPLVHDLEVLINIARHEKLQLPAWAENVAVLTQYAVETRYPGLWEDIKETDVTKALKIAQKAVEWAKSVVEHKNK
jgi:HEPN domain-containing protein